LLSLVAFELSVAVEVDGEAAREVDVKVANPLVDGECQERIIFKDGTAKELLTDGTVVVFECGSDFFHGDLAGEYLQPTLCEEVCPLEVIADGGQDHEYGKPSKISFEGSLESDRCIEDDLDLVFEGRQEFDDGEMTWVFTESGIKGRQSESRAGCYEALMYACEASSFFGEGLCSRNGSICLIPLSYKIDKLF
jgi:hypothetical protein